VLVSLTGVKTVGDAVAGVLTGAVVPGGAELAVAVAVAVGAGVVVRVVAGDGDLAGVTAGETGDGTYTGERKVRAGLDRGCGGLVPACLPGLGAVLVTAAGVTGVLPCRADASVTAALIPMMSRPASTAPHTPQPPAGRQSDILMRPPGFSDRSEDAHGPGQ
jgi:hypothetical protein